VAELHEKVLTALRPLGQVIDALDDVPETGRVTGVIISPAFEGLDHRERQHRVWAALNLMLTADEADRVGPIATLTPAEASVRAV